MGVAGFFDPRGENVFWVRLGPAVRQKLIDGGRIGWSITVGDPWQAPQDVGQVRKNVDVVSPGALHDRVERRRRPASVLASEE